MGSQKKREPDPLVFEIERELRPGRFLRNGGEFVGRESDRLILPDKTGCGMTISTRRSTR